MQLLNKLAAEVVCLRKIVCRQAVLMADELLIRQQPPHAWKQWHPEQFFFRYHEPVHKALLYVLQKGNA